MILNNIGVLYYVLVSLIVSIDLLALDKFTTKCETEISILGVVFTDKNNNTDNNNNNRQIVITLYTDNNNDNRQIVITLSLFYIMQTELKMILTIVFLELIRFAFPFDIKEIQGTFEFVLAYLISL